MSMQYIVNMLKNDCFREEGIIIIMNSDSYTVHIYNLIFK